MAGQRYRTSAGDMLDWICHRYYGRTTGAVEAVLQANPHLAELGPVYAAGLIIELPELPPAAATKTVKLWD